MNKNSKTFLITSAEALSTENQEIIKRHIINKIVPDNYSLEFLFQVNPEIIGGLVFEFDNKQIDASIAEQLHQLKGFLKQKLLI